MSREQAAAKAMAPVVDMLEATILTMACRLAEHDDCVGHIYLGSIFGKPTNCQCECHATEGTL